VFNGERLAGPPKPLKNYLASSSSTSQSTAGNRQKPYLKAQSLAQKGGPPKRAALVRPTIRSEAPFYQIWASAV
jgi:hypothetical protein